MSTYRVVPVSSISAPAEPLRHALDRGSLDELARSIAVVGLLQPIVVKEVANGYEVSAGHRRLLACRQAGLAAVPVIIRADTDEVQAAVMMVENIQRSDLSPVEEARAIEKMRSVLGRSIEEIGVACSRSDAWVRQRLELLNWPAFALEAVQAGQISVAALRPLMEIENESERDRLIECAVLGGATAAVTRQWAAQAVGLPSSTPESLGARSAAMLPLGDVQVHMPCWSCRESRDAFSLQIVRICRACIEELEAKAAGVVVGGGAAAAGNGV